MEISGLMNISQLAANWKQKDRVDFSVKDKEGFQKNLPKGVASVYGAKDRMDGAPRQVAQDKITEPETWSPGEGNAKYVNLQT